MGYQHMECLQSMVVGAWRDGASLVTLAKRHTRTQMGKDPTPGKGRALAESELEK
jgi:hypothetical protein